MTKPRALGLLGHSEWAARDHNRHQSSIHPHLRSPYFQIIPYFFRIWNLEKMRTKYGNKEMQKKYGKYMEKLWR